METELTPGAVRLRLMLSGAVAEDLVLEVQARTAPAMITVAGDIPQKT